jgi:hypothetical protein
MFGYILAVLIGGVVVAFWLASRARARPVGQEPAGGHPVQRDQPAADEPTPDRSATAPESAVRAAKRRTPPA